MKVSEFKACQTESISRVVFGLGDAIRGREPLPVAPLPLIHKLKINGFLLMATLSGLYNHIVGVAKCS